VPPSATRAPAPWSAPSLAKQFNWKVGDKIPLQGTIFPQKDGTNTWTFDLVGIYTVADPKMKAQENALLFFNWDYFDEARAFGNGSVGWYVVRVADPARARCGRAGD
jgi:putative ABC transport system permease protein